MFVSNNITPCVETDVCGQGHGSERGERLPWRPPGPYRQPGRQDADQYEEFCG